MQSLREFYGNVRNEANVQKPSANYPLLLLLWAEIREYSWINSLDAAV